MGTALRRSPERRYVEDVLGIDILYGEVTELTKDVDAGLVAVAAAKSYLNDADRNIELREWQMRQELRSANEFKSLAAEDRALADAKMSDGEYVGLVDRREAAVVTVAEQEGKLRANELAHRAVIARMNNLSAYLTYQAACKTARTASLDTQFPI